MCAGGKDDELETFRRLLKDHPTGILSVVSDTWDLWHVITNILPQLKAEIMGRDGTLVIRPDSGDPVDILCGRPDGFTEAEGKGVVELLHDIFPGKTNSKGYKTLDQHIGTIYGDAITYHRADQICRRLAWKGYTSTIPVLGVGSFTYQYNTRDTFGFAMKATWCQVNGEGRNLYKSPITDDGTKRSAKGQLAVLLNERSQLTLVNEATPEQLAVSLLKPVWKDGHFVGGEHTFKDVVERIGVRTIVPEPVTEAQPA
jgi:nicotinamide phosphoribosyltransferase